MSGESKLDLVTIKEVAEYLKVGERWVRAMCANGRIGQKNGPRQYVITREEMIAFAKIERRPGNPGSREKARRRRRKVVRL